jgi:integrase
MAHIRRLEGGKWQARYRDEEHDEHAHNFRTRIEAQRWLDDVTASVVRGDYADPRAGRAKIAGPAETWYGATATLKPSTRASYRALLDAHVLPRWGRVEVRKVSTSAVATWVAETTAWRSASTTRKALGVLRGILDLAVADRRIALNPATGVGQPRLSMHEMRFLGASDLEALAEAMPSQRDRVLTLLLGWCGPRFGEVAALTRADVDVLRRRLRIERAVAEVRGEIVLGTPKTHQARTVVLPPFLAEVLAAYMRSVPKEPAALLFPDAAGGYLRVTTWKRRVFDPAAGRAKLTPPSLRVHDLRHTAASLAIASGASIKAVQTQLGHRSATLTLDRYRAPVPRRAPRPRRRPRAFEVRRSRGFSADCSARRRSRGARITPLTCGFSGGAGRPRTSDRRIMSPLL